jgi:hypothetical protein
MKLKYKICYLLLILTTLSCDPDGITSYILKNNSQYTFDVKVSYNGTNKIINFNPTDQKTIAVFERISVPHVNSFDTLKLIPTLNKIFLKDLKNDSCWTYTGEPLKNGHYTNYFNATITDKDFE